MRRKTAGWAGTGWSRRGATLHAAVPAAEEREVPGDITFPPKINSRSSNKAVKPMSKRCLILCRVGEEWVGRGQGQCLGQLNESPYQLRQSLTSYQTARLSMGHWPVLDKSLTAPALFLFLYVAPATVIAIIAASLSTRAMTKE